MEETKDVLMEAQGFLYYLRASHKCDVCLTQNDLLLTPQNRGVPAVRVSLDSIGYFEPVEPFKSLRAFWRWQFGLSAWGFWPAALMINTGELFNLYLRNRDDWCAAVNQAIARHLNAIREALDQACRSALKGDHKAALSVCETIVKATGSPLVMAYAYVYLAALQLIRGETAKATEAFGRYQAICRQGLPEHELDLKVKVEMGWVVVDAATKTNLAVVWELWKQHMREHGVDVDVNIPAQELSPPDRVVPTETAATGAEHESDVEVRLNRLQSLHQKGVISETEYKTKRQSILDQL